MKTSHFPLLQMPLVFASVLLVTGCAAPSTSAQDAPAPAESSIRLGEKVTIADESYYFLRKEGKNLVFSPPLPPTASLGAFIAPQSGEASSVQAKTARTPATTINGVALRE